jgi:hypothetical protein
MKNYVINVAGSLSVLSVEELETSQYPDFLELAATASTLALRYKLVDGVIIDAYPTLSDADVLASLLAANAASATTLSAVSPVQFKLLFTSAERIAIRALRLTDLIVDDFFDIAEDPRLTEVNLKLPETITAINYLETLGTLASGRAAAILNPVA